MLLNAIISRRLSLMNPIIGSASAIKHFRLFIVGAGSGGLNHCWKMRRALGNQERIGICDGSKVHYYQPAWTLTAINQLPFKISFKPTESLLPKGVDFINSNAAYFEPENNLVRLSNGENIKYDCLVLAPGVKMNTEPVKNIEEALENDPFVFTIYNPKYVQKSYRAIVEFCKMDHGQALFTYPSTETFKCRGAAVKIMLLCHDYLIKNSKRESNNKRFSYVSPQEYLFSVDYYNKVLEKISDERRIERLYRHLLTEIDYKTKTVVLKTREGDLKTVKYDLLHYTPDMVCVPEIAKSPLADKSGFVDVDKFTLQHLKFPNVFSIGDGSNLPTSKTLAAVTSQSNTLFDNVCSFLRNETLSSKYYGYTACPLTTSLKKVVLAEFDYDKKPDETFPFDQRKQSRLVFLLKKYIFPPVYWNIFCRGKWDMRLKVKNCFRFFQPKKLK